MIRQLTFILAAYCVLQTANGSSANNASAVHRLHQVEQVTPNQYRFGKGDPYIVYKLGSQGDNSSALLFEGLDSSEPISGQIFWSDSEDGFREDASIHFKNISKDKIYLNLGKELLNSKWGRLDLNNCPCTIKIGNPVKVHPNNELDSYLPASLKAQQKNFTGFNVPIDGLEYRELTFNPQTGYAEYEKHDPQVFIMLPHEVKLNVAAGILLDFEYVSTNKQEIFEIFWLFKNMRTSQKRTSYFAFPNSGQATYSAFIPFSELNTDKILNGIRLDPSPCKTCKLKFNKIRLVGKSELTEYQQYEPPKLVHAYVDKLSPSTIIKSFLNKLMEDIGFTIFYLGLLITLMFLIVYPRKVF